MATPALQRSPHHAERRPRDVRDLDHLLVAALPGVQTIVAPDYVPLSLLSPVTGLVSEIVWLTAYTAGATTGTITRAQEGTTAATHAVGDVATHDATVYDFSSLSAGLGPAVLGYASTTTPQSGIGTTEVALTGMSVSAVVPAGHRVRITFYNTLAQTVAPGRQDIWIRQDGAPIQTASYDAVVGGFREFNVTGIASPTAGAHTWTVGCATSAGSTADHRTGGFTCLADGRGSGRPGSGGGAGAGTSTPLDNYYAPATGGVSFDGSDIPRLRSHRRLDRAH